VKLEIRYLQKEISRLITIERETSTLEIDKTIDLFSLKYPGYCCIPVQENAFFTVQSGGVDWSNEIWKNCLYLLNIEASSGTVFALPEFGKKTFSLFPDKLLAERFAIASGRFYAVNHTIRKYPYWEGFMTPSTVDPREVKSDLETNISTISVLDAYQCEEFDTDVSYDFTNAINRLIQSKGKRLFHAIDQLLNTRSVSEDMVFEILRAFGRIDDENTKEARYEFIIRFLKNESPIIRDGAITGLSFLDDKRALLQLRMLFEKESIPTLKNNIKVAIKGLESS
jgi:hypothetical protein